MRTGVRARYERVLTGSFWASTQKQQRFDTCCSCTLPVCCTVRAPTSLRAHLFGLVCEVGYEANVMRALYPFGPALVTAICQWCRRSYSALLPVTASEGCGACAQAPGCRALQSATYFAYESLFISIYPWKLLINAYSPGLMGCVAVSCSLALAASSATAWGKAYQPNVGGHVLVCDGRTGSTSSGR